MPLIILASALLEGLSLTLIQGFLPLYVRQSLGETHFLAVGAVVAVPALGTFIASNFWGGLSDVNGRLRPFILVGALLTAGFFVALWSVPRGLRDCLGVTVGKQALAPCTAFW